MRLPSNVKNLWEQGQRYPEPLRSETLPVHTCDIPGNSREELTGLLEAQRPFVQLCPKGFHLVPKNISKVSLLCFIARGQGVRDLHSPGTLARHWQAELHALLGAICGDCESVLNSV